MNEEDKETYLNFIDNDLAFRADDDNDMYDDEAIKIEKDLYNSDKYHT